MQTLSLEHAIRVRRSWRSYQPTPLEAEAIARLNSAVAHPIAAPLGSRVRLALLDQGDGAAQAPARQLGTYGVVRGARHFILGAVHKGPDALEDFGFVFQWLILEATRLGLATCWLGGTLRRSDFAQAVGLSPDELLPAVSPVGHPHQKPGVVDRVFRWAARSSRRKAFGELFFDDDFTHPLDEQAAGSQSVLLELLRLAPSASNRQPWRVVRDRQTSALHLFLQRSPGLALYREVDLQRIDMGIAMCHLALAAQEHQLPGHWERRAPDLGSLPAHTSYLISWIGDAAGR